MADIAWYVEASLVAESHVYCAGSLAQCVRRWTRLSETERATAFIKLHRSTDGYVRVEREDIQKLAAQAELWKI
jgi:nitrate reductase alpha subunit